MSSGQKAAANDAYYEHQEKTAREGKEYIIPMTVTIEVNIAHRVKKLTESEALSHARLYGWNNSSIKEKVAAGEWKRSETKIHGAFEIPSD